MRQAGQAVGIFAALVSVMACVLMAASGGLASETLAANGTLTPWAYLPFVGKQETPMPTQTSEPAPTTEPSPTPTQGPGGAIVIDHTTVDAGVIPQAWLDQARVLDTFFTHKSIGNNILDGIADLQAQNPGRYSINVVYGTGSNAGITHYQVGSKSRTGLSTMQPL